MPKRAISNEKCVKILKDFVTQNFTLKDLVVKHSQSLSSISKLVNFKSPYLKEEFDQNLVNTVSEIDVRKLGTKIRDSRDKKKPEIDYDAIFEPFRENKLKLVNLILPLLDEGFAVQKLSVYFKVSESTIRNWITEIDSDYFTNKVFKSQKEFINDSNKVHGNFYSYEKCDYKGVHHKVWITCPKHGDFYQIASNHLYNKCGCPKCKRSQGETSIAAYLKSKNIRFQEQKTFRTCRNVQVLPFDFFLPGIDILIEYQGIQHSESIEHFGGEKALKQRKKRDQIKRDWAKNSQYTLHEISYDQNVENELDKILSIY